MKKTKVRISKPAKPIKPDPSAPVEWAWGCHIGHDDPASIVLREWDFNLAGMLKELFVSKGISCYVQGDVTGWWMDIHTYYQLAPATWAECFLEGEALIRATIPHLEGTMKIQVNSELNFCAEASVPKTMEMVAAENRAYEEKVLKYEKAMELYNSPASIQARQAKLDVAQDKIKKLEQELAKLKAKR